MSLELDLLNRKYVFFFKFNSSALHWKMRCLQTRLKYVGLQRRTIECGSTPFKRCDWQHLSLFLMTEKLLTFTKLCLL